LEISCIALAGGKSTRLGRNKLKEVIGTKTLMDRVLEVLSMFNGEIIIVTAKDSSLPSSRNYPRVRIVNDVYPGSGSLGGIYTGLSVSKTYYNLAVACDMPFLNFDLLQYMVEISKGFDLVAYNEKNRPEMLHAVYSQNCTEPMRQLISDHKLRIIGILPFVKARYITDEEINKYDPQRLSFFNINTEADLRRAHEIVKS
jgi:molybdenum cofactor guanylyltransferase